MVPTVDDDEQIEIPMGTPSGKVFTLRQKGAPILGRRRGRGDFFVQVVVAVPKKMTPEEEELIRKLAEIHEEQIKEKGLLQGIQDLWDRWTH